MGNILDTEIAILHYLAIVAINVIRTKCTGEKHLRYRPPVLIIIFFYKIYSIFKNNTISKVFNKLQVFHFRCTVHTNPTQTVISHSCVLQKPPSCNDNGYKFEFKICRPNRHVS